ncbi:MAG: hypothetical protein Q4E38_03160 [Eubacteriales bacterium]|nr:hypothetical protein [Eubacteriales bacterium]
MANKKGNKKKSGWTWLFVLFIIALGNLANEVDGVDFNRLWLRFRVMLHRNNISLEGILPLLVTIAVVVVVVALIRAAVKRQAAVTDRRPASARTSAAVQRPDPRTKSFTRPEPACIVCDHTGEDHFQHDKAQRIKQLDEWLKNGLIDRQEYKVLLARYERDL